MVRFNDRFIDRCIERVPLAHALERCLECEILATQTFTRPVLDLGCGDGIFAQILFAEPIEVGLDPDARELQVAAISGAYRRLVNSFGQDTGEPDGSFNTVFSNSVLEHIEDLPPVLREMNRVLAPGGHFYATVPTHRIEEMNLGRVTLGRMSGRVEKAFQRLFRRVWRLYNVHPPEEWVRLFTEAGFVVEDTIGYQGLRMYRTREMVLPLSLPAWFLKRTANRWLFLPSLLRRLLVAPLARVLRRFGEPPGRDAAGYLLFLALRKT